MVQNSLLKCFVHLLDNDDCQILNSTIDGINNILNNSANFSKRSNLSENLFTKEFIELNGIDKLRNLKDNPDNEIASKTKKILKTHFKFSK